MRVTKTVGKVLKRITVTTAKPLGAESKAAAINEAPRIHRLRCNETQAT
jgi:hypothetical protein